MSDPLAPNAVLLSKLGSIIRHAQELQSPHAHEVDRIAMANLLDEEDVVQWMADMDALAMLPVPRNPL